MPRDFNHDYRGIGMYHITIGKAAGIPDFSRLVGTSASFVVERSSIGSAVERQLRRLPDICPGLRLLQYVIMPDHIHALIYVTRPIERALGAYIGAMKVAAGQEARRIHPQLEALFTDDFHDRILRKHHSLDVVFQYIKNNPRRRLIRQERPDFFSRRYNVLSFEGLDFHAYGNLHLLVNPFREQVVVHRADSPQVRQQNRDRWLYTAANGGVLVSPFISPDERAIREAIEPLNGKHILIVNNAITERYTPPRREHELCQQGRLLIMAPATTLEPGRATWMRLNRLAAFIAGPEFKVG